MFMSRSPAGNNVIRERRQLFGVFDLELAAFRRLAVHDPDAKLGAACRFDFVAVVHADVVEARKFLDQRSTMPLPLS